VSPREPLPGGIGRFVKTFLGMKSVREVTLPRGTEALIRSYTELAEADDMPDSSSAFALPPPQE